MGKALQGGAYVVVGLHPSRVGDSAVPALSYWRWVGAIFVWQAAGQWLFAAFGSLEEPERDGLIIRAVRQATDDGPMVAIVGLVFLAVFWGGIIYFVRRLRADAKSPDLGIGAVQSATKLRKGLELLGLTIVMGVLLYSSFTAMNPSVQAGPPVVDQTLEAAIDQEAALTNSSTPFKIDDITTLLSARREGRTLIIEYGAKRPAELSREDFASAVRTGIPAQACTDARLRKLLKAGANARYRYSPPEGEEAISVDISEEVCGGLVSTSAPQKNSSISQ